MKKSQIQKDPFIVPTTDGKLIEEHFGKASLGGDAFSLARMVAPPHWSEPWQKPEFDEYTLVVRGKKQVELEDQTIVLEAGQSVAIKSGCAVRYSNPFEEETEYVSLCIPAFSPDLVHRQE